MKKKKVHVKQQVWQIVQLPKYMQGMLPPKTILASCNLTESNSAHLEASTNDPTLYNSI